MDNQVTKGIGVAATTLDATRGDATTGLATTGLVTEVPA